MKEKKIREPKQQRSLEKRQKIIDAGFELFCKKGYHNTNTVEIAKLAGVSTGIVYSYFVDKKDIFLVAFEEYSSNIANPIINMLNKVEGPLNLESLLRQSLKMIYDSHNIVRSVHEEMQALAHTDPDISKLSSDFISKIAITLVEFLEKNGIHTRNAFEKMHLALDIIENLSHEKLYNKHEYLNYDTMTDIAVNTIVDMFLKD